MFELWLLTLCMINDATSEYTDHVYLMCNIVRPAEYTRWFGLDD